MSEATTEFWNWFKVNNSKFLNLNSDELNHAAKENLLDEFTAQLHTYNEHLYFEIGGRSGEEQELIITADGDSDYFDQVEQLITAAPAIDNWTYTALMPPLDLDYTSNFEDVVLKPLEIWFLPLNRESNPKSIGIRICLPNYEQVKDSEWLEGAVFRMLDTVLGEKAFAEDVDYVGIGHLPPTPEDHGMIELKELPAFVKWKKAKLATL
jgi:hypothetical protein